MPLIFPENPSSGETYSFGDIIWSYNGYAWDRIEDISIGPTGARGPTGAGGALGYWGSFWDTTDQGITSASIAYPVYFNTSDSQNNGVSVIDTTKITFESTGIYNLQFSAQLINTENNQINEATFWLKRNGTNIPDTAGIVSIDGKHSGVTGFAITSWNYMLGITANDYIELYWHSNDTHVSLHTHPGMVTPTHPLSPSVIFTAQQVMFTQLGPTGPTGATPTEYVAVINGASGGITLIGGDGINIITAANIITISTELYSLIDGGTY